ncbi:aldehyde dehydrogenase family protein [Nocardia pseudobrasiliensis]|uniref:Acyl-CoA reductase-like NAD-dependent aldehyde dehydrogenase n=1 Tax=Nocardia pseudobrasiliensis TaxID=45979 RepID=A0A370HQ16_9NOCA|nr:aldehyde dehydrogenase family protein [Nocardia pseudobrasiliensis]RDI60577.1 acyl-CoA reductase-like NAD-dependent aldehyde dehydrogenase [Nocardia pseudobrasiliensis]
MIERENPARPDEIVGAVPRTTPEQIDGVVREAERRFREWSRMPIAGRLAALARAAAALDEQCAELAVLLARESGKPVVDCRGEIGFAATYLRWVCDNAPHVCATTVVDDPQGRLWSTPRPFGVVAAITPWNAPIILAMIKLGPALAAGNTVVLKPSPLAPLAVTRVAESLPGVHVVHGGPEVVRALVAHPSVRKVAFTGGEHAGAQIAAQAGRHITPAVLELGGNDPAVFLDDFALGPDDFERLVLASFATSGQVCMAAKRLYVPRHRAAEFTESYIAAAHRILRVGDPLNDQVTMGPVVTRSAADRITALIADARADGGRVIELAKCPGGEGYFVGPVLVTDLPDSAKLVCREQFGPAVPLLTYRDESEVLARANAGELGLGASVWSADEDRAFRFATGFEAGFTFVNTHNRTGMSLRAPFGGVKRSGFGREYADEGLREYLQTTVVHAPAAFRPGGPGMSPRAYPRAHER